MQLAIVGAHLYAAYTIGAIFGLWWGIGSVFTPTLTELLAIGAAFQRGGIFHPLIIVIATVGAVYGALHLLTRESSK